MHQPASERVGTRGRKKNSENGRGAQKIWPSRTATGIYYLDGRCVVSFLQHIPSAVPGLTADCLTLPLRLLLKGRLRSLNQPASERVGMRGQKKELRKRTRGCKDMAIGDGDGVSGWHEVCCIISVTYSFGCPRPHCRLPDVAAAAQRQTELEPAGE